VTRASAGIGWVAVAADALDMEKFEADLAAKLRHTLVSIGLLGSHCGHICGSYRMKYDPLATIFLNIPTGGAMMKETKRRPSKREGIEEGKVVERKR
jgi:hypothetical protein